MTPSFAIKRNRTRPSRVVLQSEMNVVDAKDLHEALIALRDAQADVRVDCRAAENVHGAIQQLLSIACRSWPGGPQRFGWTNVPPELQWQLPGDDCGAAASKS